MRNQEPSVPPTWRQARWAGTRSKTVNWTSINVSSFVRRTLKYGIWDPPQRPFLQGRELRSIPQTPEHLEFATAELEQGCRIGTYQEVGVAYAKGMTHGALISGSFVTWQRGKLRFLINLKEQSTHWDKRSVKMETLSSFGACLCPGDHRHFALHRRMWNWFLFTYNQRYYPCIALTFGWTSSPYWFVKILSPPTRYMRSELSLRVLVWLDDYLIVPREGSRSSTAKECLWTSETLQALFKKLGLVHHPEKGVWGSGTTKLVHLELIIDTVKFKYFVFPTKLEELQSMASTLLRTARQRSRWVRECLLSSFCGRAISQFIPFPLARFFTRSLYDTVKADAPRRGRVPELCVKLSHATLRELQSWSTMLAGDGRLIGGGKLAWCLRTDAADVGFGATLGRNVTAGYAGEIKVQGMWSPFLRLKSITLRVLIAVRFALEDALVQATASGDNSLLLIHIDNMAVFHIISNMVSSNQ